MTKSGLITLWNRKYNAPGNDCLFPLIIRSGDIKKIGLSHMIDCFFVLGCGLLIGITVLVIEIIKKRNKSAPTVDKTGVPAASMITQPNKDNFSKRLVAILKKIQNGFRYGFYEQLDTNKSKLDKLSATPEKQIIKQQQPAADKLGYFTYNTNYYNNMVNNDLSNFNRIHMLNDNRNISALSMSSPTADNKTFRRQQKLYYFQKMVNSPQQKNISYNIMKQQQQKRY